MQRVVRAIVSSTILLALAACSGGSDGGESGPPDTPDTTAPAVTSFSPSGSTVSSLSSISVTFSEAMDTSTVTVVLSPAHAIGTGTWSDGDTKLTFAPATPLPYATTFNAMVTGSDLAGNAMAEGEMVPFTTRDAPTLSTSPAADAAGVASAAQVVLTFGEAMDTASVSVEATDGARAKGLGAGVWSQGNTVVAFTPATPLQFETTYTVSLTAGTTAGGDRCVPSAFSFTTGPQPAVLASSPASGANEVSTSSNVRVTFNVQMDRASVAGAFSGIPCQAYAWNEPLDTVFTCVPDSGALGPNRTYTFAVSTAAKSAGGDAVGEAYSATFSTVTQDVTAPTLTAVAPANGATSAPPNGTIAFEFSEKMDDVYTRNAITVSVTPSGGAAAQRSGSFSWDATGQRLTFTPATPFAKGDSVSWTVSATARDLAGNALADSSGWFHVVREANRVLPLVTASSGYIRKVASKLGDSYYPTTGAPSPSYVGDDSTNARFRTFWTFDLSGLTNATEIAAATLSWSIADVEGVPTPTGYSLYARSVDYGTSLDQADWATATILQNCTLKGCAPGWSIAAVTGSGSSAVTAKVKDDFANRAKRGNRSQFALAVFNSTGTMIETDLDYVADRVSFTSRTATSPTPTISVTYDQAW